MLYFLKEKELPTILKPNHKEQLCSWGIRTAILTRETWQHPTFLCSWIVTGADWIENIITIILGLVARN